MKKQLFIIIICSFGIFFISWCFTYLTNINRLAIQSEDTLPAAFLPFRIIKNADLFLDSYYPMLLQNYPHPDDRGYEKGLAPYYLRRITNDGDCTNNAFSSVCNEKQRYVSAFPIITPVLVTPVYVLPVILNMQVTWELIYTLSHVSAALIVSVSGALLYILLNKHFSLDGKKALLLTAVYLFATVNFSMMSQSLWQHGTLQLFIILSLLFLYEKKFFWYSCAFCFGILSRPTAVFILPVIGLYSLYYIKREKLSSSKMSLYAALGAVVPVLFFIFYNTVFYKNITNQGYYNQVGSEWLSKFPEGFLGIWLSPSKGILIYSPIFLFSLFGFFIWLKQWKQKRKSTDISYLFFAAMIFVHTLIMGKWKHWYGGYSYGYRMASDIIPFLILLLIPYVKSEYFLKTRKLFLSLFILSVVIQAAGIVFFDGIWHAAYDDGFEDTKWLWSIKDSEFMFNIRRILVKAGIMHKACPKCLPS